MAKFKSTMNSPLSDTEEERIINSWSALRETVQFARPDLHPAEMLGVITDIIMACYEARRAISDGWYYANKRAFPTPAPAPKVSTPFTAANLARLGLSMDQVDSILSQMRRTK